MEHRLVKHRGRWRRLSHRYWVAEVDSWRWFVASIGVRPWRRWAPAGGTVGGRREVGKPPSCNTGVENTMEHTSCNLRLIG